MLGMLKNWRRRRLLESTDTSEAAWLDAWQRLPVLDGITGDDAKRLRELAAIFVAEKNFEAIEGLSLTPLMKQVIGLQACLPILNLGLDWYDRLGSLVVYPEVFVSEVSEHDEFGVVHDYHEERGGEAWEHGTLVLAWSEIEAHLDFDGHNVVIHEVAHTLDSADGQTNGRPPLPPDIEPQRWQDDFLAAYDDFVARVDAGEDTEIDPYAAESPAEFFAVFTEAFFELPDVLSAEYPAVYEHLSRFFKQDTLSRFTPA